MSGPRASRSWLSSPPPAVALEITAARMTGVAIGDHGAVRVITSHATETLPAGLVEPALNATNISDERQLADVAGAVLQQLGTHSRRVGLVLPDSVAKVSLVRFDKVPAKAQDLEQLIRWQVRKSVPYRIEDAQVSWQPAAVVAGGGREYLVTVARRDIVQAYERVGEMVGVHTGLVDLSTFNQVNAVLAGPPISGDWLLIDVAVDFATLAVVRDGDMVFYRHRAATGEGELADLVHQTAMYHEDRLGGGGFARVVFAGASVLGLDLLEHLRRALVERIGIMPEPIDFRAAAELRDRIAVGPEVLDLLAPCVGLLLRERSPRRISVAAARSDQVA